MCSLVLPGCWWVCCQAGLGGWAPDAGSGPSLRGFPYGRADACTPLQGVTLLYGPSICTRSVQMDLRRNQVRRPFRTPGLGTLRVSGKSLRDRRVSCLPRWTVCPTRSPSQDTNRSTCRGECSWSGPLATPPGRCHLGPLANGPGRNPPYCLRSGGAPKLLRSGTSPASLAGSCQPAPPPPRSLRCWSLPPRFLPQGCPPFPRPLPRSLVPAVSRPSLVSVPALARWFAFFFVLGSDCLASPPLAARLSPRRFGLSYAPPHVPSLSPPCPRPLPGWVGEKGVGGGGRPRCLSSGVSTSRARCRQKARHLSLCRGGGGARRVAPVVALPTLRSHPRWSPRWGLHGACSLRARSCGPSRTLSPLPPHPVALSSGGVRFPPPPTFIPHPWGGGGVGGAGAPLSSSLRSTHVAGTTQARRKHEVRHLAAGGGGGFLLWAFPPSPWYRLRTPGSPAAVAPWR